jgi:REP-associated tyrosine transposase
MRRPPSSRAQQAFAFAAGRPRARSSGATRKTGGPRGADAKRRPERAGFVPHVVRPAHDARHPVHVTMKRVAAAPSLRSQRVFAAIVDQLRFAVARGVRIFHFSVQGDHVHLMVEADDRERLARGMQLFFSRVAFAVNRVAMRSGKLFRERHHRRELATPTEVRRCLVYVMFNDRKHFRGHERADGADGAELRLTRDAPPDGGWFDVCSSSLWFEEWDPRARPPPPLRARHRAGPCPLVSPRTWLARTGYKRAGGAIRFSEVPAGE